MTENESTGSKYSDREIEMYAQQFGLSADDLRAKLAEGYWISSGDYRGDQNSSLREPIKPQPELLTDDEQEIRDKLANMFPSEYPAELGELFQALRSLHKEPSIKRMQEFAAVAGDSPGHPMELLNLWVVYCRKKQINPLTGV